jgi:anti-sigma regulatory factor (Ser/Thr protein kinase)
MSDPAGSLDVDQSDHVLVEVPASTGHLRLVRLLVSSVATSHGADLNDLEDLRIATGEICATVIADAGPGDRLVARAEVQAAADGEVVLRVRATVPGLTDTEPMDELSSMVLDAAADEHGVEPDVSGTTAWFARALHPVDPSVD